MCDKYVTKRRPKGDKKVTKSEKSKILPAIKRVIDVPILHLLVVPAGQRTCTANGVGLKSLGLPALSI